MRREGEEAVAAAAAAVVAEVSAIGGWGRRAVAVPCRGDVACRI
jgi:hypothetical protein